MRTDEREGLLQQSSVFRFVEPCRAPGRMREHHHIELMACPRCAMDFSYCIFELRDAEELSRREGADGDDEIGPEDRHLSIEVLAAIRDLDRVRDAVASFRIFSREASNDGADVDSFPKPGFRDAETLVEPAEETLTGGEGERTFVDELPRAWSLPDEHDPRGSNSAGDRFAEHIRAGAAGMELRKMLIELRVTIAGHGAGPSCNSPDHGFELCLRLDAQRG
jgi:hypothetical protein